MIDSTNRQTRRTKRLLSDALMELMIETSYDLITVQEIADRADVGRATFYNHYNDKEQLLTATLASIQQEIAHHIATTPAPPGSLPGIRALLQGATQRPQLIELILTNSSAFAQVHETMTEDVRTTIETDIGHQPDLEPAPAFIAGAILGAIRWWTTQHPPPAIETMEHRIDLLVRTGIEGLTQTITKKHSP